MANEMETHMRGLETLETPPAVHQALLMPSSGTRDKPIKKNELHKLSFLKARDRESGKIYVSTSNKEERSCYPISIEAKD
ncbi:hypothetical protein T4B_2897 [Trichinella pseudospiralis]|uniref:Uncharacterized protein n=2 Tax=Trichinella pseudospiralis TaxID=6337 RepID=A0A0V1FYZ3_TRIPS|nr:hypothetical protein T4E_8726 [Trichinella pseudospiralis]KRY79212.1 hypothetical protein T4A_10375 [Trichinella pseudospiralis]KRY91322.1 hypothetical protein T4D_14709 [Trichinella pseudospiralis]KRZ33709.1 hypothetical protein T4B_2897 [Trichinella pseudospiralis]KRZ45830.1 hypothetical protein T4C_3002 [Trichinella pseudospiralis]